MRTHILISSALLLALAACGSKEEAPADPNAGMQRSPAAAPSSNGADKAPATGTGSGAGSAAATGTGGGGAAGVEMDEEAILKVVPTVEEAAAKAAAEVNSDNAEQMLAEIRKEVGGN